jgi:hypothetical protein
MPADQPAEVTAVDVLLEPDATMLARAASVNDALRAKYPNGFSLDAAHRPHVTMVQGYFPTARLDEMFASVQSVLDDQPIASWTLTAVRYYYLPWQDLGLAGIVVTPCAELANLQRCLLEALAPFRASSGTADAYVTTPDEPDINQPTMDYVGAFEQVAAGDHFNPHVTVGIGSRADLDTMLAEPFDEFNFAVVTSAAYQLGNFGTASRLLHRWELHS